MTPLSLQGQHGSADTDFRLPASPNQEGKAYFVLSHSVCGNLLRRPQEMTTGA